MNNLLRTLMTYSESYTPDGGLRKTNLNLVNMATENAAVIYKAIKDGDYTEASTVAYETAREIVENLELVNDSAFMEYKSLRDFLRTTKINLSEEDSKNIPDFAVWKKKQFNRLRIVKEGGLSADSVYAELCEVYPELFDETITHPADQLMAMAEVRGSLEPYDMMLSEEVTEQLIKQTAQDILDVTATGKPWKSWADRYKESYEEKLKLTKARHKEAMRDIKIKERMRATRMVNAEKLKARERSERQKLHKEHVKHFGSINKNWKWLADRLIKPTDDKHIPEEFKTEVAHLLQQFDLQTERSKKLEKKYGKSEAKIKLSVLKEKFAKLEQEGIIYDDGTVGQLLSQAIENKIDGKAIDELSNAELRAIDILLQSVRHNITSYNKNFSEHQKQSRTELAESIIYQADKRIGQRKGKYKKERGGWAGDFLMASNITPREMHERMGSGVTDLFMGLRKGFDDHIDNITEIRNIFETIFKKYNKKKKPGSKIEKWRGKKDAITVELDSGTSITMSRAQVMSLYCAAKREQYAAHIMVGGIKLTDISATGKIGEFFGVESGGKVGSSRYILTEDDMKKLINELTEEQIAVADELHGILNGICKDWGNETSMKIFGYKKFTEKNYFPIKASKDFTNASIEEQTKSQNDGMNTILNAGFTKNTVSNASNPVVIDDIFTVVAEHINQMSLYKSLAPAILDYNRILKHKRYTQTSMESVEEKIRQAWGDRCANYMNRFIKDVNGNFKLQGKDALEKFAANQIAKYKKVSIAASTRVAVQQPTAIVRATMFISPRYFVNGKFNIKKNMRDMKEHCQIARWKSWGFSQVDMANDIEDIMMNRTWARGEAITMGGYGFLDNVTWSFIWAAVKTETKAKYKDVEVGSDEFYRICNERASEIFDKTQTVDSVFHRSQAMRNTDLFSKTLTSFGSEPTKTYSMVLSQYGLAFELAREGHYAKAAGKIMKASAVYVNAAAATSAAAAVVDAFLRKKDVD